MNGNIEKFPYQLTLTKIVKGITTGYLFFPTKKSNLFVVYYFIVLVCYFDFKKIDS